MIASKLSIIIPTYNSEAKIAKCLDSIFEQTFKDLNVIIADGSSVDNTLQIISNYMALYSNIHLLSAKDNGIYDAMNKGVKVAKSEWLYFLGSDDYLYNDNVLSLIFSKNDGQFDVIYGNVYSEVQGGVYDGEFSINKIFLTNICHQSIFFKRTVFKRTGLFNLNYKAHADWIHNICWFKNPAITKNYVNIIIANFSDGGLSSHYTDAAFEFLLLWKRYKYFKHGIKRPQRLSILKNIIDKGLKNGYKHEVIGIIRDIPAYLMC